MVLFVSTISFMNKGIVQMAETGKTNDKSLAAFIPKVWLISSSFDIEITIEHISGQNNAISDLVSWLHSVGYINQAMLANLKDYYVWDRIDIQKFNKKKIA